MPVGVESGVLGALLREAVGPLVAVSGAFPAEAVVLEVAERPEDGKIAITGRVNNRP